MAKGDPFCEWHLRTFQRPRGVASLAGGLLGGVVAAGALWLSWGMPMLAASLPLAGMALAYGYESRRAFRRNLDFAREMTDALRDLAHTGTDARQELLGLHQRQRNWTRLMEEQVRDRSAVLQQIVGDIRRLKRDRDVRVQGVSSDLHNPLQVIKDGSDDLLERFADEPTTSDLLEDLQEAVQQMDRMLDQLVQAASSERALIELSPEVIEVAPLVRRLGRRLRALTHGSGVRTSVFRTREAPKTIETDPLLLDRVLDNLLTNAAKYTSSGSILVEVGGTPGTMMVKVADTGRGIDAEQLRRMFQAEGSPVSLRAPRSFGVGLAIVVELMDQVGGQLEVQSKPGRGTTFWAWFPVRVRRSDPRSEGPSFDRVVRIRPPS